MNITFLVGHLAKERHSLLYELALDLGEHNNNVTVITGFPSRRITEKVRHYYLEHPIEQVSDNVKVIRVGSKSGEGNGLFIRMIKYVFLTVSIYKQAKRHEADAIYIYSTPPFLGLLGSKLKKIAPTLYNAQDLFPDTLVKMKKLSENNFLVKFLRSLEKKVYNSNAKIVTISEDMKNTIIEQGCNEEKVEVIQNWVDIQKINKVDRENNQLFAKFNLDKNSFYISYAGDIGLFQNWEVILDAAEELDKEFNDIKFVIIGNGSYKDNMEKSIKRRRLNNVFMFPLQPIELVSSAYSLGDLELVSLEKEMTKIALPSKVGQILAAGSPLLGMFDSDSYISSEIKNKNLGAIVDNFRKESLVELIKYYYNNQHELDSISKDVRLYAEQQLERKTQTSKYNDLLRSISS
ncbi:MULTISPECIES: glycosyltransferase family 4 protein [unclassified Sedimentibacter]|uniref:glycosyltransferase family 4 protein n=1 Tax=unclassified Sedimentibacter TaxID=2649220 RepID=UPI0027DF944F|nr:glycosyltransferase family 4 protein [Sedimentibacter sp. MB35-C1]WMJ78077.1 glycosyltransferase family 4 protein [Sedimentibacter sp. MB35-C1]